MEMLTKFKVIRTLLLEIITNLTATRTTLKEMPMVSGVMKMELSVTKTTLMETKMLSLVMKMPLKVMPTKSGVM